MLRNTLETQSDPGIVNRMALPSASHDKLHWNYFLALENDLETLTRYIEFDRANFNVFSIELAHLLFAAASEVDVLAKRICEVVNPAAPRNNIDNYRAVMLGCDKLSKLPTLEISIPRYGLKVKPWVSWSKNENPAWWRNYNDVKHERNKHFHEATLENVLNAMGVQLAFNFCYLSVQFPDSALHDTCDVTRLLKPESKLIRLPPLYYGLGHAMMGGE